MAPSALRELAALYSTQTVEAYMTRLLAVAADSMQRWIETLDTKPMLFSDSLDDGSQIAVSIHAQSESSAN